MKGALTVRAKRRFPVIRVTIAASAAVAAATLLVASFGRSIALDHVRDYPGWVLNAYDGKVSYQWWVDRPEQTHTPDAWRIGSLLLDLFVAYSGTYHLPGNLMVCGIYYVVVVPLWLPTVILAAYAALNVWRWRCRRVRPGHCASCGYDLTGNISGRCPECGVTVTVAAGALRTLSASRLS